MNLLDCARIATRRYHLVDREDYMQDMIVDVLSKRIEDRENAFIIRSMKNSMKDRFIYQKRWKRGGTLPLEVEVSSEAPYDLFEFFCDVPPRLLQVAIFVADSGYRETAERLGMSIKRVRNIFCEVKRTVLKGGC